MGVLLGIFLREALQGAGSDLNDNVKCGYKTLDIRLACFRTDQLRCNDDKMQEA